MSESHNDIIQELQSIAPTLAEINRRPVFAVPEGYFDEVLLNTIRKTHPVNSVYKVEEHYFVAASNEILSKVNLGSLSKEMPYSMPENYFEQFQSRLKEKLDQTANSAKVISIQSRFSVVKYAMAAVLVALLGLTLSMWIFQPNSTGKSSDVMLLAQKWVKEDKIEDIFASLTPEEIIQYLEDEGEDIPIAMMVNTTTDAELPSPDDYYFDPETLDNLMQELSIIDKNESL